MGHYLSIHTSPVTAAQLRDIAKTVTFPAGVTWHGTLVAEKEQKLYAEWDAPDAASLGDWLKSIQFAPDAIQEVERVGP
jgi:hypothetical protein